MNRRDLIKAAITVPALPILAIAQPEQGKCYRAVIHFDGGNLGALHTYLWVTDDQRRRIQRICWE